MFAIGIDIGGTNTRIGLVSKSGELIKVKEIATDLSLPPHLFIKLLVHEAQPYLKVASSLGIGIAGQIENGFLHFAPNLNWRDLPVGTQLSSLTGLPVVVENDVRAALFGEWVCGAGLGYNDIIMVSLGTGLGGAIVAGGKLIRGSRGASGEFGHICINIDGPECSCGSHGCLEAYVGGWAMTKQANGLSPSEVFKRAQQADAKCATIVNGIIKTLGAGIASLLNVLNPQCVLFSGGIFQAHPGLIENIQCEANKRALPIETARIVWKCGILKHPGVIGSALCSIP